MPIPRDVFEAVIRESGKAVATNLATFALGFDRACGIAAVAALTAPETPQAAEPPAAVKPLIARIEAELPFIAREFAIEGLRRTIDFQDLRYGALYLDRLQRAADWDAAAGGSARRHEMIRELARHLALWMTFDDTFRVADLKTRGSRFERFRAEVNAAPDQIVAVTEFMHPRLKEVADSLPAGLGRWAARQAWLGRWFAKGRKVETSSLRGFLMLSLLAMGRRWRRSTLRFQREDAAIESWLERVRQLGASDYAAAVELVRCQKLIRGYGETNERGARNFARIMAAVDGASGAGACRAHPPSARCGAGRRKGRKAGRGSGRSRLNGGISPE